MNTDSQIQTDCNLGDEIEKYRDTPPNIVNHHQGQPEESKEFSVHGTAETGPTQVDSSQREQGEGRYPKRQRKAPE